MQAEEYQAFTRTLLGNLEKDGRVVGLVAVGSMAQQDYQPDQWSDHDFFVVVEPGTQAGFHKDLSWLPQAVEIVFSFQETEHGRKVVYRSGHLLEFAVFDTQEISRAKVNRYRVLLDRTNISQVVAQVKTASSDPEPPQAEAAAQDFNEFGEFITNLLVGVGRHNRGERFSGRQFVKSYGLMHLLRLLEKFLPAAEKSLLDNLDPFRRVERVYPQLGAELNGILEQDTPAAARGMLRLAGCELSAYLPDYPAEAVETILKAME